VKGAVKVREIHVKINTDNAANVEEFNFDVDTAGINFDAAVKEESANTNTAIEVDTDSGHDAANINAADTGDEDLDATINSVPGGDAFPVTVIESVSSKSPFESDDTEFVKGDSDDGVVGKDGVVGGCEVGGGEGSGGSDGECENNSSVLGGEVGVGVGEEFEGGGGDINTDRNVTDSANFKSNNDTNSNSDGPDPKISNSKNDSDDFPDNNDLPKFGPKRLIIRKVTRFGGSSFKGVGVDCGGDVEGLVDVYTGYNLAEELGAEIQRADDVAFESALDGRECSCLGVIQVEVWLWG
jgi:hypothetical protein